MSTVRVLSIDAWRYDGGWNWNDWRAVGELPRETIDMSTRNVLRTMRKAGYLTDASKGRVSIEDDGYNIVVMRRHTLEPLFALEYGANEPE